MKQHWKSHNLRSLKQYISLLLSLSLTLTSQLAARIRTPHSHAHAHDDDDDHTTSHKINLISSRCLAQGALTCEARLFHLVDVHVIITVAIAAHLGELVDARWCRCQR